MGLIRSPYVGLTFIEPKQAIRNFGVKLKLNPSRSVLNGNGNGPKIWTLRAFRKGEMA